MKADADALVGAEHAVVETIDDHRPVVGGRENEGEFAPDIAHRYLLRAAAKAFHRGAIGEYATHKDQTNQSVA